MKRDKPLKREEIPLVVPPGVGMCWDDRRTLRQVHVRRNTPWTAAGEIAPAKKVRRALTNPDEVTLFGPVRDQVADRPEQRTEGTTILVFAAQQDMAAAVELVNLLTHKGYAAESRIEPETRPGRTRTAVDA